MTHEELPEEPPEPLNVSNLSLTRALFRSGARLAAKVARAGRLQEGLDICCLDTTKQQVQVTLASDRQQHLQTFGHWVAIFEFGDNDLCVCEETAVDTEGVRFGAVDWVFRVLSTTVSDYLEKDGGVLQCRYKIEHQDITVQTSKAELLQVQDESDELHAVRH